MLRFFILATFVLASDVTSMYSSKSMEGYPAGYLGDCPGALKPAIITKKSLKHVGISVQGPGTGLLARSAKYSYSQVKELAKDPDLDFRKPTMLYVGGYLDSPSFPFARTLGSHYSDLHYNVLHLDSNWFTTMEYPLAVRYMRPFSKRAAEMLANLTREGLDPKTLEVVGLSLGGQTMSFVAKYFRELTGKNISTLIGLDPAGPCYRNLGPEDRLDPSDADFVNVIHTNMDGFGMAAPTGHVNFYVNGGEFQPGDVFWTPCNVLCSHLRSYTLWLSALRNPKSFIGLQCDSIQQARNRKCYDRVPQVTNILSQNTDRTKPGLFYLSTTNNHPYYLGSKGLLKEYDFFSKIDRDLNKESVVKI